MLQRIFRIEIAMLQNLDSWKLVIITGILLGILIRTMGVRRQKDFKDTFVAVVFMWGLIHATNLLNYPSGTVYRRTLALSVIAVFCPVTTFMVLGFLLMHLIKKFTDR